jgi:RNA polymerase sigma factor (sigma-70 family)
MTTAEKTEHFSALYDHYIHPMFNFGLRFTSDRELIKDCIHDVFVKVYQKDDEQIRNASSYLFIALRNKILDEFRRKVFVSETPLEDCQMNRSVADTETLYLHQEAEELKQNKVARLMDTLTRRQKEVFRLYYLEERKYEDICETMDMNYHSVRNLVYRGMLRLREAASM